MADALEQAATPMLAAAVERLAGSAQQSPEAGIADPPGPPPTRKKVAIVGFASSTRDQAPFKDPEFEIWGMNELYTLVPRWDRLFEMHTWAHLNRERWREGQLVRGEEHIAAMAAVDAAAGKTIYMLERRPEIPASRALDVYALGRKFGQAEDPYFTSSPAYMLALALLLGFEEIHLYGIDLLQDEEYAYQRPCMEFYCGIAIGMGRVLHVPKGSALLKANYLYGVSEPGHNEAIERMRAGVVSEHERLAGLLANIEARRHTLNGAAQALRSVDVWFGHLIRGGLVGGSTQGQEVPEFRVSGEAPAHQLP